MSDWPHQWLSSLFVLLAYLHNSVSFSLSSRSFFLSMEWSCPEVDLNFTFFRPVFPARFFMSMEWPFTEEADLDFNFVLHVFSGRFSLSLSCKRIWTSISFCMFWEVLVVFLLRECGSGRRILQVLMQSNSN